jgi:hypothetical protein
MDEPLLPVDPEDLPAAVCDFLAQHPEYAGDVRRHPDLGTVMRVEALDAFSRWCERQGLTTADRARHLRQQLRVVAQATRYEQN